MRNSTLHPLWLYTVGVSVAQRVVPALEFRGMLHQYDSHTDASCRSSGNMLTANKGECVFRRVKCVPQPYGKCKLPLV